MSSKKNTKEMPIGHKVEPVDLRLDTWEKRISMFSKTVGKSMEEVERALAEKPLEITEETPRALEMLSDDEITPFGDLRHALVEKAGISLPLFRMGVKYLRGPKENRTKIEIEPNMMAIHKKYGMEMTIDSLSLEQLLEFYDPSEEHKISEILRDKYERKYGKFIAYKKGSKEIAIDDILNYIADIDTGFEKTEYIDVDGDPCKLYGIGEIPKEKLDEDPLYPGHALKRNRSTKNRISWEGIDLETRQFFRVLYQTGLIQREDRLGIGQIIVKSIDDLKEIFPEAYIKFIELKEDGELPKLKVKIDSIDKRVQDPFRIK